MSIIHEKLYQSNDLIHINVSEYIKGLVLDLFNSYNIKKERIKLTIDVEAVSMGIETAVPCGLIISELISNSLKYAFPEEVQGEVYVGLKTLNDNGKYELKISDNGIGLQEYLNFHKANTLGLQLVNILTKQLNGLISINREFGTEFKIIFKELNYNKRI
jgi:two-component sensor histidine kinase